MKRSVIWTRDQAHVLRIHGWVRGVIVRDKARWPANPYQWYAETVDGPKMGRGTLKEARAAVLDATRAWIGEG